MDEEDEELTNPSNNKTKTNNKNNDNNYYYKQSNNEVLCSFHLSCLCSLCHGCVEGKRTNTNTDRELQSITLADITPTQMHDALNVIIVVRKK